MTDPYKVLGVSRDAGTDEIKRAYRALSRKYHPDANVNNPNKDKAEEMFKLVQQAYKQIMDERERGGAYDYYGETGGYGGAGWAGWFGGSAGSGQGVDLSDPEMQAAANYINARHYAEAMNVLSGISNRTPSWYYLRALVNAGLGNNVNARTDAQTAVNMEPENLQFRQLLNQLSGQGAWYDQMGRGFGYGGSGESCCGSGAGRGVGGSVLGCCALSALCNCCGAPYGFCCC